VPAATPRGGPPLRQRAGGRHSPRGLLLFLASMTLVDLRPALRPPLGGDRGDHGFVDRTAHLLPPPPGRSLEATWKYILICSVGDRDRACSGNFFLAVAGRPPQRRTDPAPGAGPLGPRAAENRPGRGLRAGDDPLPGRLRHEDGARPAPHLAARRAHSEGALGGVGAPLRGAPQLRVRRNPARAAGMRRGRRRGLRPASILVGFGLGSMAVAAVFIPGQADYKRLLAYSQRRGTSGILALRKSASGGVGTFGALLHAVGHSLTKAMLFPRRRETS